MKQVLVDMVLSAAAWAFSTEFGAA